MSDWTLSQDLDAIIEAAEADLLALRGQRLLITGGTGFVGTWLLWTLHHADSRLGLAMRATVLTRDPETFSAREPALADWTELVRGDVTATPEVGTVDAVVHAATPASAAFNDAHPEQMRSIIVDGMGSVLAAIEASGPIPFLFTSSGAVYGSQPLDLERIAESYVPASESIDSRNAYALGKRDAEALATAECAGGGPSVRIARLFSFVGPYLPLDAHFAIGNFIRDGLQGGPIRVAGDGTSVRSYMYASDLVPALVAILVRGTAGRAYNVGSNEPISIADLAELVQTRACPTSEVIIEGRAEGVLPTGAGSRYVPDTTRIVRELGVGSTVTLPEAIDRTLWFARKAMSTST